jgi:hypothetical protein
MRTVAILASAGLLLATGAAMATEVPTDSGRIMGMNAQTGAITLDDGHHYVISNPTLLKGVAPGEHVIVTENPNRTIGFQEDTSQYDGSGQND